MSDTSPNPQDSLSQAIEMMQRRLRKLTVAVIFLGLLVALEVAAVFVSLADYHSSEPLLFGSVAIIAALVGFGFGFGIAAGRRMSK